jgi:hypothetical protein
MVISQLFLIAPEMIFEISPAGCCPSPSTCIAKSKSFSKAKRNPVCTAPPIPRLIGKWIATQGS